MDNFEETKLDVTLFKDMSQASINKLKESLKNEYSSEEIDRHVDILHAIDAQGVKQLKGELKVIHEKNFGVKNDTTSNFNVTKILLGLLIASLLGLAAWFVINNSPTIKTSNQLYAEYYEPFDYTSNTRDGDQKSTFELGVLYQKGQFVEFIQQYEQHHKQNDELSSDFILAVGIGYTEIDQPYKGIYQLDKIIDNKDFNFIDSALWYKALALLKANEIKNCKEVLAIILNNKNSEYYSKAEELNKELQRIN